MLKTTGRTIACRVRRCGYGYAEAYPGEFTIRAKRDSGAETELSKIMAGWCDWMFYGHEEHDFSPASIRHWMLIDLHAFRAQMSRNPEVIKQTWVSNRDREGTHFVAFNVTSFKKYHPILIASS